MNTLGQFLNKNSNINSIEKVYKVQGHLWAKTYFLKKVTTIFLSSNHPITSKLVDCNFILFAMLYNKTGP